MGRYSAEIPRNRKKIFAESTPWIVTDSVNRGLVRDSFNKLHEIQAAAFRSFCLLWEIILQM